MNPGPLCCHVPRQTRRVRSADGGMNQNGGHCTVGSVVALGHCQREIFVWHNVKFQTDGFLLCEDFDDGRGICPGIGEYMADAQSAQRHDEQLGVSLYQWSRSQRRQSCSTCPGPGFRSPPDPPVPACSQPVDLQVPAAGGRSG